MTSLFGAVRLLADGWDQRSPTGPTDGETEMPPVDVAAWHRWALDTTLIGRRPGEACRLPAGGLGRVTEVFESGRWILACEADFERRCPDQ